MTRFDSRWRLVVLSTVDTGAPGGLWNRTSDLCNINCHGIDHDQLRDHYVADNDHRHHIGADYDVNDPGIGPVVSSGRSADDVAG